MPQVKERGMLQPTPHRVFGDVPLANSPLRMSETPAGIRGTAPDMGQHSREVLTELLHLDDATLEDLVERKVVWEERPPVELG
jgi:crotonobetainyl-CoA:carnitine CoA-transferase CaiB-like acyl-CoA transferase